MKLKYQKIGDYLLPNLFLKDEKNIPFGKYSMMRLNYLKEYKKVIYNQLLVSGTLINHLKNVENESQIRIKNIINQLVKKQNITEKMKEQDQILWIKNMNNIRNIAEEIVISELIFV